jgi:hypothetical protein
MTSAVLNNWQPQLPANPIIDHTPKYTYLQGVTIPKYVNQEEFDKLKKEVQELKELLIAAKKFDESTNQKDCEQKEKVKLLKELGKHFGVDLDNVI